MRDALHAEWTKLRTGTGTVPLLLTIVALTIAAGVAATTVASCPPAGCPDDPARISLFGVQLGQAVVAVLAVVAITSEFSTGMIRTTLTAMPRRVSVLAAKATLVTGLTFAAGTVAVLVSILLGRVILTGNGFTAAAGDSLLSLADGPTARAAVGSVLYLGLIAVLSLGIGAAVRDPAVAIGAVLGLFYFLPITVYMVSDPDLQRFLWQISPTNAGLAIQATTDLADLPLGPWAGLGALAAWATAALAGGGLLLRLRDA